MSVRPGWSAKNSRYDAGAAGRGRAGEGTEAGGDRPQTATKKAGTIEFVICDFGGVVTTSPFEAFVRFERGRGLPEDLIRRINATNPLERMPGQGSSGARSTAIPSM